MPNLILSILNYWSLTGQMEVGILDVSRKITNKAKIRSQINLQGIIYKIIVCSIHSIF